MNKPARYRNAGLLLVVGLVAGCTAHASAADDTACKLFAAEENDVTTAINLWIADGRPSGGSDLARSLGAQRTSRIEEASQRATGDVAVAMSEAARLSRGMDANPSSQDIGTAFFLTVNDVYDACRKAGVKLNIVESASDSTATPHT